MTDGDGPENGHRCRITEPAHRGDERTTLVGILQRQRDLVAWKLHGVEDAALRPVATPTGLTAHGLVRHLTAVERFWLRDVFSGESDLEFEWSDGTEGDAFRVGEDVQLADLLEAYAAEAALSDAIIAGSELDTVSSRQGFSLRWVLLHLVEETGRHLGHLDLLRERADGVVGEEPEG